MHFLKLSIEPFPTGLEIPPEGCAVMRVGRDMRSWVEGKVLLFDDSFEHEVFNTCDVARVVFQVVLRHPEIPSDPAYKAVVRDAH
eukprot:m.259450 g.259450  ORF g.259450 m.259450 type:complete len:85 (-) comp19665_c0_seq6:128-382(-)